MPIYPLDNDAKLFVPDNFRLAADGTTPILLHLHGGHEAVQKAFVASGRPGILITLILPGLSAVYTKYFQADPARAFFDLLDTARKKVNARDLSPVWVSSFSAGFGGVRELLRSEAVYERLETLVLADTLYAGFARAQSSPEDRPPPDPSNIKDFVRFAHDAADRGDRSLLVTYCDLLPPTYSATRETAEALRQAVGAANEPRREEWPQDLTLTSHSRKGRFATYGFSGEDGPAHMRHLHGLNFFYRLVPRA